MVAVPDLFSDEICLKNLNYYEEKTIHDSSLSAPVHSILYARTGSQEISRSFFLKNCNTDFGSDPHSSEDGIHAASMAGIWLSVFHGFGGIIVRDDEIHINPGLPKDWEGICFPLKWRGSKIKVEITHKKVEVWLIHGEPVEVFVNGVSKMICKKEGSISYDWDKTVNF
jgi:hypothetical glycosyl hydrolase